MVAAVVCLAGSVATMLLLERARRSAGSQRHLWIAVCAFACGVGVWSTHFIAMLAYDGGIPIAYGVGGTSFSIAVAIAASWVAFSVGLAGTSRHAPAVGGLLLGLGIAAMHVSGMRAIAVQGRVAFDPETSFAAVLLGTLIAGLALHSFQVLRGVRGLAASILLLVAAICVLHFTSMSGVVLIPDLSVAATHVFDPFWLAGGVIAASTTLILMAFGALFVDRHLTDLKGLANASLEGMVILRRGEVIEVTNASPLSVVESPPSSSAGNGGSCSPRRPKDGARTTSGPERGQARESSFTRTAGTCPSKGSAERSNTRAGHAT